METSGAMVADIASRGAECPCDTGSFIGMFQHVTVACIAICMLIATFDQLMLKEFGWL